MTHSLHIHAHENTVRWGYFGKSVAPVLVVKPGAIVSIETLAHHAWDDIETLSPPTLGAAHGHTDCLLTGPVKIEYAEPGDVLEVRILDVIPRAGPGHAQGGHALGMHVSAWSDFHGRGLIEEPVPRQVVTIYQFGAAGSEGWATAVCNYIATEQDPPEGDLGPPKPGALAASSEVGKNYGILEDIRVPTRLHFGAMGLAPAQVDSSLPPPKCSGGNVDDWRIGKGARMYYPVAVRGALFSVGDPHAAHGDSELFGTAIEASLTGVFQFILHKAQDLPGTPLEGLDCPLLETDDEWVLHGFSASATLPAPGKDALAQGNPTAQSGVERATRDASRKMRRFLMQMALLTEDEALSLLSVAVDFGLAQAVDGHWSVHASLRKELFSERRRKGGTATFFSDFHRFPLVGINGDDPVQ